jgi:hypothetical protein
LDGLTFVAGRKIGASSSEITPGNRRTVGRSWCARLPASPPPGPAIRMGFTAGAGHDFTGSDGVDRNCAELCDFGCLRPAAIRSRCKRWREPSSWPSEKPTDVSAVGGNAVIHSRSQLLPRTSTTAFACASQPRRKAPVRNGSTQEADTVGEAPRLAKRGKPRPPGQR